MGGWVAGWADEMRRWLRCQWPAGGRGVVADEVFDVGVWWGYQVVNVGGLLRDQMFEFGVVWGSSVKFEVRWITKCSILGA